LNGIDLIFAGLSYSFSELRVAKIGDEIIGAGLYM
jgi:hypothetical protein